VTRTARSIGSLAFIVSAAIGIAAPSTAHAQNNGWALDRFESTPAGDLFFAAERPWYTGPRPFAIRFGVIADYARNPLVIRGPTANTEATSQIVDNMLALHAQLGIALVDRIGIHVSVPVSVLQTGTADPGLGLQPAQNPSIMDPRIGARFRIVGQPDIDPISLSLGGALMVNAAVMGARRADNVTDDQFRGRVYANASGRGGPVRWSLTAGANLRLNQISIAPVMSGSTIVGNEFFANAALAFVVANDSFTIGPEVFMSSTLDRAFEWRQVNLEVLLGMHYLVANAVLIGIGGGPGLTQGAGTPQFRGLFQLAYAPETRPAPPPPPDTDMDGVLDPDDLCPTVPMGDHPDPARRGCPLADRDHDTILDPQDICPDEPRGEHPDPERTGCPDGDEDHDTVLNHDDLCRTEPHGEHPDPERRGCPDGDDDHDGVLNHSDQCRTEPAGQHPDPNRAGCPLPDRDHDTVVDPEDHCPDQPGAPNPDPNLNGCPGLVRVADGMLQINTPVFFATNRDVILPRSFPVLTAVANALRASPQIRRVSIEGHTDDIGDDNANMELSRRRAQSVLTWLSSHNVEPSRLESHGFGETRPQRPIAGLTGRPRRLARATNRRVEFRITDPAPDATAPAGGLPIPAGGTPAPAAGTTAPTPGTLAPATAAPIP